MARTTGRSTPPRARTPTELLVCCHSVTSYSTPKQTIYVLSLPLSPNISANPPLFPSHTYEGTFPPPNTQARMMHTLLLLLPGQGRPQHAQRAPAGVAVCVDPPPPAVIGDGAAADGRLGSVQVSHRLLALATVCLLHADKATNGHKL